jgi:hypothetical protein
VGHYPGRVMLEDMRVRGARLARVLPVRPRPGDLEQRLGGDGARRPCHLLRRRALGYVFAAVLLVLLLFVAATIIAGTVFQVAADVDFTMGEIVGPIAGFLVLAAIGAWLLVGLLREAVEGGETEWRRSSG